MSLSSQIEFLFDDVLFLMSEFDNIKLKITK